MTTEVDEPEVTWIQKWPGSPQEILAQTYDALALSVFGSYGAGLISVYYDPWIGLASALVVGAICLYALPSARFVARTWEESERMEGSL